jgi:glutaredoxin 2
VRLALGYKGIDYDDHPLDYDDDETFFELGLARTVPILMPDAGPPLTDSIAILERIDELFPGDRPLVEGRIDPAAWSAMLDWRGRCEAVLERLYTPGAPAYAGLGDLPEALAAYKAEVEHRYGMSLEALANDRYDGFGQFDRLTGLNALARHLSERRYYMGEPSIADALLAADLYPLQILDGISLPIDLMYYLRRVEETCATSLDAGLLSG